MTFTLYMVRHGQTILNSYNRLQGWCDSPLTQKGINDAKSAGKHLADIKFDKAYHSDTTRAMRTCHFILENNHHSQDNDEQYWARLNAGFEHLRKNTADGQKVLLVSHSITIRSIVDHFAPDLGADKLGPKNGAVTKLTVTDADVKVQYYNHYLDSETY